VSSRPERSRPADSLAIHPEGQWALYVVGLLATVTVTVYVTRLARAALAKRITA